MSSFRKIITMWQNGTSKKVFWNQLNENKPAASNVGINLSAQGDILHLNGVTTGTYFGFGGSYNTMLKAMTIGKYIVHCQILNNPDNLIFLPRSLNSKMVETKSVRGGDYITYIGVIDENSVNKGTTFGFSGLSAGTEFNDVQIKISINDLTLMFGAGNEPTTVEEFHQRIEGIPVDIYAYNPGEIIEW